MLPSYELTPATSAAAAAVVVVVVYLCVGWLVIRNQIDCGDVLPVIQNQNSACQKINDSLYEEVQTPLLKTKHPGLILMMYIQTVISLLAKR